jgi:hypothetical protein
MEVSDESPLSQAVTRWGGLAHPGADGPAPFGYWVIEGRLAAGGHPAVPEGGLDRLLGAGVHAFVDLTEPGSPGDGYRAVLDDAAPDVTIERFPIPDFDIPSVDQAEVILDVIDRLLDHGRTVYVHCLGGRGRTGTVIGCWLIRHGLAGPDTAVATLTELRASIDGGGVRSPETEGQHRFVESWSQ